MGSEQFIRTALLLGEDGVKRLRCASVAVFGVGGVGSFAAEALARAGIGRLLLVDPDAVAESNINRQLIALHSTIGMNKAEVMRARILDINPEADVTAMPLFYDASTAEQIDLSRYDFVVDAIDTVSSKLLLIERAAVERIPIISSMGAGNKLNPAMFEVADIYQTSVCPLARVMRRELRNRGVRHHTVLASTELPRKPLPSQEPGARQSVPGSVPWAPPCAGMMIAGYILRALALPPEEAAE